MPSKLRAEDAARNIIWKIEKYSNLTEIVSPVFALRGNSWKFAIRKVLSKLNGNSLNFLLYKLNEDQGVDVACIVNVSIKLISFDENVEPHQVTIIPSECGGENPSIIFVSLISLEDISASNKNFIQNDTIVLEIDIKADEPQFVIPDDLTRLNILSKGQFNIKLNLLVKNLNKRTVGIMSPMFHVAGRFWKICTYRNGDDMGIYLIMVGEDKLDGIYDVTTNISLSPLNGHVCNGRIDWNTPKSVRLNANFIKWHDLFNAKKPFVKKGSFELNIDIAVNKLKLDENDLNCPICMEDLRNLQAISLKCGHIYCNECMDKTVRVRKRCPLCSAKIVNTQLRRVYLPFTLK